MRRVLAFAMTCLILVGCQTVASGAVHPTGDASGWKIHRVQVDDRIVEFSIPAGESAEFSAFSVPDKVDLSGADSFDEMNEGPTLLKRAWDYRKSRFSEVEGTLRVYIGINVSNRPIENEEGLKGALYEGSDLYAEKIARGRAGLLDPPVKISRVVIGGLYWTRVDYRLSGSYFVRQIDKYHYLKASARLRGFSRADWHSDAQAAADSILHSIRILPE